MVWAAHRPEVNEPIKTHAPKRARFRMCVYVCVGWMGGWGGGAGSDIVSAETKFSFYF